MRKEKIDAIFCFYAALWLLVVPIRWTAAVIIATAVHEGMHLLALHLCGLRAHKIRFSLSGICIFTDNMDSSREICCAAAGPVGSLLLISFVRHYPELAFCGLVQGMYNLLPVYPSDGGRILRCLCHPLGQQLVFRVETTTKRICVGLIMITGIAAVLVFPRWLPLILPGTILSAFRLGGKIPCIKGIFQV